MLPPVHISTKAKFLVVRGMRPYANEGPGSCYSVACVDDAESRCIALAPSQRPISWDGLLGKSAIRMTTSGGRGNTGSAMWGRATSGVPLGERLAQLEQLCDGGERYYKRCVCGVRHREYFTFSSVGGFAQFCLLMTGVLFSMNEPLNTIFYPPSPTLPISTT
ncbi:hypothetical protein B0H13DRAFT_2380368 [Mycena leptocephala]|nr:hypothetical protein B0H13DRAFT_2380368 [Mycena leptocephala]